MYAIMYIYNLYINMAITNTMSISEARSNIFDLTDRVQRTGQSVTLVQNGRAKVIIMSIDEYESWKETLEIMREMPDILEDIERGRGEFRAGKTQPLDKILKKLGYPKLAEDYETLLSHRVDRKSKKGSR